MVQRLDYGEARGFGTVSRVVVDAQQRKLYYTGLAAIVAGRIAQKWEMRIELIGKLMGSGKGAPSLSCGGSDFLKGVSLSLPMVLVAVFMFASYLQAVR